MELKVNNQLGLLIRQSIDKDRQQDYHESVEFYNISTIFNNSPS